MGGRRPAALWQAYDGSKSEIKSPTGSIAIIEIITLNWHPLFRREEFDAA
jgi:hypothetical protein